MIVNFDEYSTNQSIIAPNIDNTTKVIHDYLGAFENRMVVFENNWCGSYFQNPTNQSMEPFLKNISKLIGENVDVSHFTIHSKENLMFFLKSPGVLWGVPQSFSVNIWYFGLHADKSGIQLPTDVISKDEILDMCTCFNDFSNILYFSSCSLFEDEDFGFELLETSGSRGIFGYTKEVPFFTSTIIDLLAISSFFLYKSGNPFDSLDEIYSMVLRDFPLAKKMGFKLFC